MTKAPFTLGSISITPKMVPYRMGLHNRVFFEKATREEPHQLSLAGEMEPIPKGDNPMWHDGFSMGAMLSNDWQAMFCNENGDMPIHGLYLVNIKTGQRFGINIDSKTPRIKKVIRVLATEDADGGFAAMRQNSNQSVHEESRYEKPVAAWQITTIAQAYTAERHPHLIPSFQYFIYGTAGIHCSVELEELDTLTDYYHGDCPDDKDLAECIKLFRAFLLAEREANKEMWFGQKTYIGVQQKAKKNINGPKKEGV